MGFTGLALGAMMARAAEEPTWRPPDGKQIQEILA
jgi:hypothetical protein